MKRMLLTAMLCCMTAFAAIGATVTWQGGDGDWSVASNWGGVKPKDGDAAVISDSSTVTVTTDEAYRVVVNLTGGATLEMREGGKLNLATGDRDFGIASVANGTASVLMTGGAFEIYGNPHIGQYGTGSLRQTGGTIRCAGYFSVGRYAGSVGTAIIEGGELIKEDGTRSLLVGEDGEGTLVVKDSGTVRIASNVAAISAAIPGGIQIAYKASATGTLRLESGGTIISPRTFVRNATGTFVFAGGVLKAPEDADSCGQFLEQVGGVGVVSVESAGAFVDVPIGVAATISASVTPASGSVGGFVKLGEGSLALTGTNTWVGVTIVSNGTLVAETPFALPGYDSPNRVRVEDGAVLATGSGWTAAEIAVLRQNMTGTLSVTIDTTSGDVTLAGNENYESGLSKLGTGTLFLTGRNTIGGDVSVLKGALQADFGQGLDAGHAVVLNGGTLSSASGSITAGLGTGAGQIAITPGSPSGFTAKGVPLTVNLGGAGATLSHGSAAFNPIPLVLNGAEADQPLTFANGIDYSWLTVRVDRASVALTGPMAGAADGVLAKIGNGEIIFSGDENCSLGGLDHRAGTMRIERPMSVAGKIDVFSNVQLFVRDSLETAMDFWQAAGALTQVEEGGTLQASNIIVVNAGTFRQNGGVVRTLDGESAVGGYENNDEGKSAVAVYEMNGGQLDARENFQVGRFGTGIFEQNGGDVSVVGWPCVGRFGTGVGTFRHHGGTFSQTGSYYGYVVGELGLGLVEIDGTAEVSVAGGYGLYYLPRNGGKSGELRLNGGTLSVRCITPTAYGTNRTFRLNGGTLKTTENTATFVKNGTLTRFEVGAAGGVVDTVGHDVTFNQALTEADAVAPSNLVHRWSFNGDVRDSIGGTVGTLDGTASLSTIPGSVKLPGGEHGASAVDLGANLLPTGSAGFTIEVWATMDTLMGWTRCLEIGSNTTDYFFFAWSGGKGTYNYGPTLGIYYGARVLPYNTGRFVVGTPYHIAVTAEPVGDGTWTVKCWRQVAGTGEIELLISCTAPSGWSPAVQNVEHFWLGRSLAVADHDAYCSYDEVRIWKRPLTERELVMNDFAGPDAEIVAGPFVKAGQGTLTLTGANTYAVPTEVEGGTLALAAGASMASDVLVKTGGVFAVATTATPPSVALEVGENGACGYVTPVSGTLDLGSISLSIANPETLANGRPYVICRSQGGFTGSPSVTGVPSSWQVNVLQSQGEVRLAKSGMTIIFR